MAEPMTPERFRTLIKACEVCPMAVSTKYLRETLDEIERLRAENAELKHQQKLARFDCYPKDANGVPYDRGCPANDADIKEDWAEFLNSDPTPDILAAEEAREAGW